MQKYNTARVAIAVSMVSACFAQAARAAEPPAADNFVVLEATTELQKISADWRWRKKNHSDQIVWVWVNASPIFKDENTVDYAAINVTAIYKALKPHVTDGNAVVRFQVMCPRLGKWLQPPIWTTPYALPPKLLELTYTTLGRQTGFSEATTRVEFVDIGQQEEYEKEWKVFVAKANAIGAEPEKDQTESAIGDEEVRLFPVKTLLSRKLFGGADCVIQVVAPMEDVHPGRISRKIRKYFRDLEIEKVTGIVMCVVNIDIDDDQNNNEGSQNVQDIFGAELIEDALGFERRLLRFAIREKKVEVAP